VIGAIEIVLLGPGMAIGVACASSGLLFLSNRYTPQTFPSGPQRMVGGRGFAASLPGRVTVCARIAQLLGRGREAHRESGMPVTEVFAQSRLLALLSNFGCVARWPGGCLRTRAERAFIAAVRFNANERRCPTVAVRHAFFATMPP